MKAKKTIATPSFATRTITFHDEGWAAALAHVPQPLDAAATERLREQINECCNWLLTERNRQLVGHGTAVAMRSPGKGVRSPMQDLAHHIRRAADAWKKLNEQAPRQSGYLPDTTRAPARPGIHDDLLSDLDRFNVLSELADDAERRLASIMALGEADFGEDPWRLFVRKVADCFARAGIAPTSTGRVYGDEDSRPTWFQEFMVALNNHLLGVDGKGPVREGGRSAFYAGVAKALRGDARAGKTRE